jgi:diguanylate cyclase (GGDEF)-like protein
MFHQFKYSSTILPLLIGFSIFVTLFLASWVISNNQLEEYEELNTKTQIASEKMEAINRLIHIARTRTRLSHNMVMTEDIFDKDEINMKINALASDFIINRRKFVALDLTAQEKEILDSQQLLYPKIIDKLNLIAELSFEESNAASDQAMHIIFHDVMPMQDKVIDGFTTIMQALDNKVHGDSMAASENNRRNSKARLWLLFFILMVSLITIVVVIRNILKIEERLQNLSATDSLTGILNRRAFHKVIQKEWKNASRCAKPLSIRLIDIDYFKNYNDHYGHQEGDDCLIKIAGILKRIVYRTGDIVARYGGEEFIVVLPSVDKAGADMVAERLLDEVRKENIPHQASETEQIVTISIGYASMLSTPKDSIETLIKAADEGLYKSKRSGKNRASSIALENQ